jgi:hypothetical protein
MNGSAKGYVEGNKLMWDCPVFNARFYGVQSHYIKKNIIIYN